jgi:hypothetical protein
MPDQLALIQELSQDRALASAMLFSHRHIDETPPFHVELLDDWASPTELMVREAFREGAKSTLAEESIITEAAFGNFHYCLLIGETYDKTLDRMRAIKYELTNNDRLINIFGRQRGDVWNENEIVLRNGVKIQALGWEQEIKSYKHLQWRPDRALLDDIETIERTRDSDVVELNWRRLYRELIPAMDKRCRIRWIGTPLAADCMIVRARASAFWDSKQYPICNGEIDDAATVALWPARYPMDWIRNKRDLFEEAGDLKGFYQEYMLVPHTIHVRPFDADMLKSAESDRFKHLPRYVQYDPARTANVEKSARSGKVVVSFSGSKIIVRKSQGEFWMPDALQNDIIEETRESRPLWVGIEKNSLDEWLLQPLRALMLKSGVFVPLVPMNAPQDSDKQQFIMSLQPFLQAGDIQLIGGREQHKKLVEEITNFPAGKNDVLNALALALRLRPGMPVYEDFGADNILSMFKPSPLLPMQLAVNATGSENCFALLQIDGNHMHVFRDWVQPGSPDDAIRAVSMAIKLAFPGHAKLIEPWAPGEVFDNWARTQILSAVRRIGGTPSRGEYASKCRGALNDLIRTSRHDHRLLTVSPEAFHTINALSGGYCVKVGANGRPSEQAEANHYRTLVEGIESLTAYVVQGISGGAELPGATYATTADGRRYATSLPQRNRR